MALQYLPLLQAYNSRYSGTATNQALVNTLLNRAQEERRLQEEAQRLSNIQAFQRDQQERSLRGQQENDRLRIQAQSEQREAENKVRRDAAQKSFGAVNQRLAQVQEDLQNAVRELDTEVAGRVEARVKARMAVEGKGLQGEEKRALEDSIRASEEKITKPNLSLAAKVNALTYEFQRLTSASNALLDDAVRYGADVGPLLTTPRPQTSTETKERSPLPAAGANANPLASPERKPSVEGMIPSAIRKTSGFLGDVGNAVERDIFRPLVPVAQNLKTAIFGGEYIDPSAIYSPEELLGQLMPAINPPARDLTSPALNPGMFGGGMAVSSAPGSTNAGGMVGPLVIPPPKVNPIPGVAPVVPAANQSIMRAQEILRRMNAQPAAISPF